MAVTLSEQEHAVLSAFVENEKQDPEGTWNCYYHSIIEAAGGNLGAADAICRELRRRKLLVGQGRGQNASYYPSDAGKEAVAS